MTARQLLLLGIYEAAGISPEVAVASGTSITLNQERRGTGVVVVYQFERHTMVWCEPEVVSRVETLVRDSPTPESEIREFVQAQGHEYVGASVMKTIGSFRPQSTPDGFTLHRFDWSNERDVAAIQRLVDASSEHDLDESEVAMDDLDEAAVGLLDARGDVAAFASMRPFDYAPTLGDIGVLVAESERRKGLGAAVVARLVETALPAEWDALYRCDPYDNPGSDVLSARLGFELVTSLIAFKVVTD